MKNNDQELVQLSEIGQLVLTRKLELKSDNTKKEVLVKIGKPEIIPDDESEDFYCPFQIIGMGDEGVDYVCGVDSLQAMLLTMERIGIQLRESSDYKEGKLTWLGELTNLGFPAHDSSNILSDIGYPHFHQGKDEKQDE